MILSFFFGSERESKERENVKYDNLLWLNCMKTPTNWKNVGTSDKLLLNCGTMYTEFVVWPMKMNNITT